MEILNTLGINWQLLLAQIINFAIVLGLLAKFVYRPLLKAIDARRDMIRRSMEEAQEIDRQNREMEERRQELLRKADTEAGAILERAKTEADSMRKDIVDAAQKEAAQIIERGHKQVQDERTRVFEEVQDTVAKSIIRLSQEIIRREFTAEDQKRLLKTLEQDLPALLKS